MVGMTGILGTREEMLVMVGMVWMVMMRVMTSFVGMLGMVRLYTTKETFSCRDGYMFVLNARKRNTNLTLGCD